MKKIDISKLDKIQLAGQRVMAGFNGTELNSDLKYLIKDLKLGGVILFSRNIKSPDQLKQLCNSIQDYALTNGELPLFIAIDQEGGMVARLKEPFTIFPGNSEMKNVQDADNFAKITASELKQVGINMNMAPVMDVAPKEIQSIMKARAFGHEPEWVSKLGCRVIKGLQSNGIMSVAKHFPGIGRTILDSHLEMPFLDSDITEMEKFDLPPFDAAIKQEVSGMMLSHIFYTQLDPKWPASLSPFIANTLLRQQMGFKGLVITDDLDMGAIQKNYDIYSCIKQIIDAKIDIALICHKGPNIEKALEEILRYNNDNYLIKQSNLKSIKRIVKLKQKYCV